MKKRDAIELVFVMQERMKAKRLCEALATAIDVTITAKEQIHFTISEGGLLREGGGGLLSYPELPHLLVRHMFERGALLNTANTYLAELDQTLKDQFGIVVEDD